MIKNYLWLLIFVIVAAIGSNISDLYLTNKTPCVVTSVFNHLSPLYMHIYFHICMYMELAC